MTQKIVDISRTIETNALVIPGDAPIEHTSVCTIAPDCPCNITQLGGWTTHFLTHVDPPLHFVEGGASLDDIPLSRFTGPAIVIEVTGDMVTPSHIPAARHCKGTSLLFKTRNSALDRAVYNEKYVYVTGEAAKIAAERGVNLVGIDYISIDKFGDDTYPAHRNLLGSGVLILEGLDLSQAAPGRYTLAAMPLKIAHGDGSPVRAVLFH